MPASPSPSPPTSPPAPMPRPRRRGRPFPTAWIWVLGACLGALVATYLVFVEPPPPRRIVIAGGGEHGAYYRFATRYAAELAKDGLAVEVRATAGSVENLRLLGAGSVAAAIVQSGVAGPEDPRRLVALGSLYREPLWVFTRGAKVDRLAQLAGKRVGIGAPGSGTHAIARQLLAANGLIGPGASARVDLVDSDVDACAGALRRGELDAAFFVAASTADYIRDLLRDDRLALLGFDQHEAYHRRFRFLSPVTVPAGLVDLGRGVPAADVSLLAPTAMLVARRDLHPALVPLLLAAAGRVHAEGDEVSAPGEFPSPSYCDLPVADDARHFFRSGPPVLQRLLPFWLASLVDRAKVMLIPLVMLMMPLLRATPPLMRWRTRRKIYLWYSDLRAIDQTLLANGPRADLDAELARLHAIEHQVAHVDVPLSYMEEFYHLRLHLALLKQHLTDRLARDDAPAADPAP